jgi:hypothetical protein
LVVEMVCAGFDEGVQASEREARMQVVFRRG